MKSIGPRSLVPAPPVAPTGCRSSFSRSGYASARVLVAVTLLCALSACTRLSGTDDGLDAFRDALASSPGVAPRLSFATEFRPCTEHPSPAGTITVADCPAPAERRPTRFPLIRRTDDDPRSLHLLALIDLVTSDPRGKALDRSITSLRRLAELTGDSAPALADLAAALIVRAERTQAPRDLLEAYEMAQQAVDRAPRDPAALYNRALAIDRFGLVDETEDAWQAYLAIDSTSGWAGEARQRIRAIRALQQPLRRPPPGAPLPAYATYAAHDPQGARELGMDSLLAQWGAAAEAGDAARAEDALRHAEALGTALERRPGGDRSLADAVRAIRAAAGDRRLLSALARAHHAFGRALTLYDSAAFEHAEPLFRAASANAISSAALQGWVRVYLSTIRAHIGRREHALKLLRETADDIDARMYPAMSARVRWSLGNSLARAEQWEQGLDEALASARLFEHAGEFENDGGVLNVIAAARFVLGEPDSGYAVLHRGLGQLRSSRASLRLHNLLSAAADQTALDGLQRAAIVLTDEDVRVASRQEPKFLAEALLRRSRHVAAEGGIERAKIDVDSAWRLLRSADSSYIQKWYRADLLEAAAATRFTRNPDRKMAALDSAAAFFAGIALPVRLLPILVGAAEARLTAGDPIDAARRLEQAMRLLEQRRDSIRIEPRRAAVFDAARAAVDRLVMLKLRQGRMEEALRYMDRARASLAPAGPRPRARRGALLGRPGEVSVEYALVGDTLLAWTVVDGQVSVARTPVNTARLVRTLEHLESRLEAGAGEAEVQPALSELYEWLIRPVEGHLGAAETPVVLVADGVLAGVPFSALRDARTGRYLIDDHPLRFMVSLAEAARPPPRAAAPGALFVADPAFDPKEHPLLERLALARTEVRNAAAGYPGATLLDGPAATRAALEAALPRAGIAYFGGHAVFDDARPERSYLVLAPAPGAAGRVTADELARLDLHRVRLVVLSACRTMRTGHSRAAGYSGLSGALLAAGAAGTVGSTWNVEEGATAALMAAFQRAYATRLDGPLALREAQRALAHGNERALRSPSAWAGFKYAGR